MSNQLIALNILIIILETILVFINSMLFSVLNDGITNIEDMLRKHIENENELYNRLLINKIKSKIH